MSAVGVAAVVCAAMTATLALPSNGRLALSQRGLVKGAGPGLAARGIGGLVGAARRVLGRAPGHDAQRGWSRSRERRRRERVLEICVALAGELRSGAHPDVALQRVSSELPGVIDQAAAAARLGGDVPAELSRAAAVPGGAGLALIGACWAVAARTGSALAPACDRAAETLRQEEALRHEVSAQLAGARASARLMAGLPILGVLLGTSMGARPLAVLVGSTYGLACLASGALLAVAGLAWTERLARTVEDAV